MTDDDDAQTKAKQEEEEVEEAKKVMEEIEEGDPPEKLEDWPGGKAKYQTYGGPDSEGGYEDGATAKLGPSNLRHHDDGSVTIDGDQVDDPDEYKGEPIPGGPSDPDAPPDPAMIGQEDEDEDDDPARDAALIAGGVAREDRQRRHDPLAAQRAPELAGRLAADPHGQHGPPPGGDLPPSAPHAGHAAQPAAHPHGRELVRADRDPQPPAHGEAAPPAHGGPQGGLARIRGTPRAGLRARSRAA